MGQQVRWFAGAAAAAGVTEETVAADDVPPGTVREALATLRPGASTVLQRCTFLADGRRLDGDAGWPQAASTIDVLPPLAGG